MENKKEMTPLSASRIKTAQSCNYKFWSSYFTDLPNTGNPGSAKGSVVHELFEMLGNPRHKHRYDELIEKGSIFEVPVIERYIKKLADREGHGVNSDSEMKFMDTMIMNSLRLEVIYQIVEIKMLKYISIVETLVECQVVIPHSSGWVREVIM